jgi:hypothetical protein
MMRITMSLLVGAIAAAALVGCGERPQVIDPNHKPGVYQGKADTDPWKAAPYSGDKAKWETDIKARNQAQNEYRRVN